MQTSSNQSRFTHYEVLGVDQTASLDALRKAYQAMALAKHPDRNASDASQSDFHSVQLAWETLRDPDARRAYDATLRGTQRIVNLLCNSRNSS